MTKPRSGRSESARAKPALTGDGSPADCSSPAVTAVLEYSCIVWQIYFRHNFFEKLSPGPKIGLERCVPRFSTICGQTQGLNLIIGSITVILPRTSNSTPFYETGGARASHYRCTFEHVSEY